MNPFVMKPGETVVGLGIDFATRLASTETITAVTATASAGVTVVSTDYSGTIASAIVSIASDQVDADLSVAFAITGNLGSVRKGTRSVLIRAASN